MGVCLCKDKLEDATTADRRDSVSGSGTASSRIHPIRENTSNVGIDSEESALRNNQWNSCPLDGHSNIKNLSETVDKLVNETLDVIGTIVDK